MTYDVAVPSAAASAIAAVNFMLIGRERIRSASRGGGYSRVLTYLEDGEDSPLALYHPTLQPDQATDDIQAARLCAWCSHSEGDLQIYIRVNEVRKEAWLSRCIK